LHPKSRGTVTLQSNDFLDHPIIETQYLKEQDDVRVFVEGCKRTVEIWSQPALKDNGPCLADVILPGNPYDMKTQADQYWEYYVRHMALTIYHPMSTVRMGRANDPEACLTPDCRVKGVTGLRVVDASIVPELMSGNTNIPCVAIGERAAEIIKSGINYQKQATKA